MGITFLTEQTAKECVPVSPFSASGTSGLRQRVISVNSLVIKKYNVNELRARAHDFMDQLRRPDNRLGCFGECLRWNTRDSFCRVEEIAEAFKSLLRHLYPNVNVFVSVMSVDFMPEGTQGMRPVDGISAFAKYQDELYYFVVLDKKSLDAVKGSDKTPGPAFWCALKTIFLHEISHTLLNHPGLTFFEGQFQSQCDYRYYLRNEDDADLMSYVLAFWPSERFRRRVDEVFESGNLQNIRLEIANEYRMPVNSVVQWMVIMLSDPTYYKYWLHYAWLSANPRREERGEAPGEILDCYDCQDVLKSLEPNQMQQNGEFESLDDPGKKEAAEVKAAQQLFRRGGTAANYSLRECRDSNTVTHKACTYKTCKCVAFYEQQSCLYNRESDEVVLVGLAPKCINN